MLRLFAWVRVTSATGKSRRRLVSVRKAETTEELVLGFKANVARFITDPLIRGVTVDVRTPPAPEDEEFLPDEEDVGEDDFAWRHDARLTGQVVGLLEGTYPSISAGHVAS